MFKDFSCSLKGNWNRERVTEEEEPSSPCNVNHPQTLSLSPALSHEEDDSSLSAPGECQPFMEALCSCVFLVTVLPFLYFPCCSSLSCDFIFSFLVRCHLSSPIKFTLTFKGKSLCIRKSSGFLSARRPPAWLTSDSSTTHRDTEQGAAVPGPIILRHAQVRQFFPLGITTFPIPYLSHQVKPTHLRMRQNPETEGAGALIASARISWAASEPPWASGWE